MYYQGEKAVDLWGGVRNKATGEPWEEDTMVIVHSTTEGLAGLAMALAHSRGWRQATGCTRAPIESDARLGMRDTCSAGNAG
jgi:hypothetical protein